MGKTNRHEPRNGEFKKLKASKQKRNKKQRAMKATLRKEIGFSSNAWDIPNDETIAAMLDKDLLEFDSVEELMKDLDEQNKT